MKKVFIFIVCLLIIPLLAANPRQANRVDIYYFHQEHRCQQCLTNEEFIKSSINQEFSDELKNGTITLNIINYEEEKNSHYAKEYNFDTQTLIISKVENNKEKKWNSAEKIWEYGSDFDKFKKYLVEEIRKMIE